ncbi:MULTISPECIES: AtpZ/AtpI family protein [Nocardioides]|uniref:AtpZ/AtpI family protein n=1 Tax=Nocardioides TaxID=1839 RepID=UPI0012F8F0C0|nr:MULTISPECIES: AtpZ/AtpI family protein [unclassified Nocardioides]
MSQQDPSAGPQDERPKGDPWHAFGYIVSGVAIYGFLGWLIDRWLGTDFIVAIGIIVGAGLGIYLTFSRFNRALPPDPQPESQPDKPHDQN